MAGEAVEVGQFVAMARKSLINEPYLANAAIIGELTKLTLARSGHSYFTLTDNNGSIDCVLFNGNKSFTSLDIKEGSKLVALGGIDVYVKTGRMQFKASRIQPVKSIGELEKVRQELILKWREDGTMDRPRKTAPLIPKRLHIITGGGSAALSDMQRLITDRWPNFSYTVIPVLVQGNDAPKEIVRAIKVAEKNADLIIVGRGGGSPEDLWSFNLESVCQAMIDCSVPVVSAVGHESDYMVSDMIADIRASTPSNAIERCVGDFNFHQMNLHNYGERIEDSVSRLFIDCKNELQLIKSKLLNAPVKGIYNANQQITEIENKLKLIVGEKFVSTREKLNSLTNLLTINAERMISNENTKLAVIESSLKSVNPKNVLERGYSMITSQDGEIIMEASDLDEGQTINLLLSDGEASASINSIKKGSENNE